MILARSLKTLSSLSSETNMLLTMNSRLLNGVVERKNKKLQEMACVMFKAKNVLVKFWVEALNTTFYTQNRVYLRPEHL